MKYLIYIALYFFLSAPTEVATIKIEQNVKGEVIMTIYNKGKYTDEQIKEMICGDYKTIKI